MAFRGWFTLDGVEFANSSRLAAHLGTEVPTTDYTVFGVPDNPPLQFTESDDDGLYNPGNQPEDDDDDGLYSTDGVVGINGLYPILSTTMCGIYSEDGYGAIPPSSQQISPGLWTPPNGARRFGPGLFEVSDECWGPAAICGACDIDVDSGDDWPGLKEFLGDYVYRPELAPWYTTELPESGEFAGVWVTDVQGLDVTPSERPITDAIGHGGVPGPHRDAPRRIAFEAVLIGCSNAGVDFGLKWLNCLLRTTATTTTSTLRYLAAHPGGSSVDPESLVRELHGVVLTKPAETTSTSTTGPGAHRQANVYTVSWEMTATKPYAYLPPVAIAVDWDSITHQPINFVHHTDCAKPESCEDMPVLFSTDCIPEEIERVSAPPPVCGGCMPVGQIAKYSFTVPTQDYAFRCRDTSVSLAFKNISDRPLTLVAFWRLCGADFRCDDNLWPVQITGLAAGAELHLDGITGRFWAHYDGRIRRTQGIVATPKGAPWRPPLIDRQTCWEFVIQTPTDSRFTTSMVLTDREP